MKSLLNLFRRKKKEIVDNNPKPAKKPVRTFQGLVIRQQSKIITKNSTIIRVKTVNL